MTPRARGRFASKRGASLVEFALVLFQLFLVLFAALEFARIILVYTNVANSARVAVRYAIVHGGTRPGTGINGQATAADVCGVVTDYAKSGLLDTGKLVCNATTGGRISVTWPDATNTPGSRVVVTVVYPYDPFTVLPLKVPLGSSTEGIITF